MKALAQLRQAIYRLLAALFLYPTEARRRALVEVPRVLEPERVLAAFPFFLPWERLLRALADLPASTVLQEEYVRLFTPGFDGCRCAPYESAYHCGQGGSASWLCAELEREYAFVGLALSNDPHEPADHLAVELEYMAFLCGREAEAWGRGTEEARELLDRERNFLNRHLVRWVPEFARSLQDQEAAAVYRAGAAACEAFVLQDLDLVCLFSRIQEARR
ncbi:MAG: molecular chaperone TorD family protein [Armatimonadota bacterium]|nr:molecular chaperone TorD family protein [Armatimonadota bacterium]